MIGITISSGGKYDELASEAQKRFMRFTGLNCIVLHTQHDRNYSVKLQLWKMFKHTEQSFVFFDCDCWAVRSMDLEQFDNREEFFAVEDSLGQEVNPSNWEGSFTHKDAKRHGIPFDQMINGGFWIANAKYHEHIFRRALAYLRDDSVEFDDFGEQSALSKSLHDLGRSTISLEHLPVEYNAWVGGSTELKDFCPNPFFIHAAAVPAESKMGVLKKEARLLQ